MENCGDSSGRLNSLTVLYLLSTNPFFLYIVAILIVGLLLKGIIQPLKDETDKVEVQIKIRAEGKLSEATLNRKVKETLQQLGVEYTLDEG